MKFSKLKLTKCIRDNTQSPERMSKLAILSIDIDFNVDFNTAIERFAQIKTRRF